MGVFRQPPRPGLNVIFIDKAGRPFEIKDYEASDHEALVDMYERFSPKGRFQGMPPVEPTACRNWVVTLIQTGENLLAWQEGEVMGHGVLLPDFQKGDAEYLIFVLQSRRGQGVGTALTRVALWRAEDLRLKRIWLTVEPFNFRATRLYRKCGFGFCEPGECASERTMIYSCGCAHGS